MGLSVGLRLDEFGLTQDQRCSSRRWFSESKLVHLSQVHLFSLLGGPGGGFGGPGGGCLCNSKSSGKATTETTRKTATTRTTKTTTRTTKQRK